MAIALLLRLATVATVAISFLQTSRVYASSYDGLVFYFVDNHQHSGFSGDIHEPTQPIDCWLTAKQRAIEAGMHSQLGGYFQLVTDHVLYLPDRLDMTPDQYQTSLVQVEDPRLDLPENSSFTFTAIPGAEITGLRRVNQATWDDKFGHLIAFNFPRLEPFAEDDIAVNIDGDFAMDALASTPGAIGEIAHPGYFDEPVTGDDPDHPFAFSARRAQTFRLCEVRNFDPVTMAMGIAQYNVALQTGYRCSPVIGLDLHGCALPLPPMQACTVVIGPPTLGLSRKQRSEVIFAGFRNGTVYATENTFLRITWSLAGARMGSSLAVPAAGSLAFTFTVCEDRADWFQRGGLVRLVRDIIPSVSFSHIASESQLTHVVKQWPLETACETVVDHIAASELVGARYAYLHVVTLLGRAVTSPVYFV